MIKILIADDHKVVRQGVRALLSAEPEFSVVGEAGEGPEAVDLAERLKPDVMIVDLMMPGLGGLEIVRQVTQRSRRTRLIVLSMYANAAYVYEAMRSGASGYVPKDSSADELAQAVREVAAGRRYLSAPFSEETLGDYSQRAAGTLDLYDTLTNRQREVLHLLAHGLTSAEIAERLSISRRTAETHRGHVMKKLSLHSQVDLIRFAIRRGILPVED